MSQHQGFLSRLEVSLMPLSELRTPTGRTSTNEDTMMSGRGFRPCLECLEDRCTPAGTVTGSFANGTWTLIGDPANNSILINPTATPGTFSVTGLDGTGIAGVMNPTNVNHIVVRMLGGDDAVNVNDTGVMRTLSGKLSIEGGAGANNVYIRMMTIKNVSVVNGSNATGTDEFYLEDSIVKGNLTIANGEGDSETGVYRTTPGVSYIAKEVSITNGAGRDRTYIIDYNVGGSVKVTNGLPDAMNEAGYVEIFNETNLAGRSVIGGSVLVNYTSGVVDYDGIWDYEVRKNVRFNYGTADAQLFFDGYIVSQPVLIRGNLTVNGTGPVFMEIGNQYLNTGLIVGNNLTVTTGEQADTFNAFRLQVNGITNIMTSGGIDTVTIDDSYFQGSFTLNTGSGADEVNIETRTPTTASTQFISTVLIDLSGGDDTMTLGFAGSLTRQVELYSTGSFLGGSGTNVINDNNVVALLGMPITIVA
jgi:hypothetical protein